MYHTGLDALHTRHLPFYYLTENLAEKFPSDSQILPSGFRCWGLSTVSPNSDGEIRNYDGNSSSRLGGPLGDPLAIGLGELNGAHPIV